MSACERWVDELGAYVLDGLDPAERARVEEHLAACPACRREVDELAEVPPNLDHAAEELPLLPETLRQRALTRATAQPPTRAPSRRWQPAPVAAAAAAGLVLGAVVTLGVVQSLADDPEPEPDLVATIEGIGSAGEDLEGEVFFRGFSSGTVIHLDLEGFDLARDVAYYQVWLEDDDGQRISAGTLVPGSRGQVDSTFTMAGEVEEYQTLELTLHEEAGDSGRSVGRVRIEHP